MVIVINSQLTTSTIAILLSNPSSCAWHTVRPNNLKCWNFEQRKVYCKAQTRRMGWLTLKRSTQTLQWFSGKNFYRQNWGECCRVCDPPLTGWWWGNRGCSRNLYYQPCSSNQSGVYVLRFILKLPPSTWVGALVPTELRYVSNCYAHLPRKNQDPAPLLYYGFFCILSLRQLATVRICPLELREGLAGWKPFSYK